MRFPIRVFSDLHLGHPANTIKDVNTLAPLLKGAGTAVFNGDTCQMLAKEVKGNAQALLEELIELCEQLNVEPIFLPGNHDPQISERTHLELFDGRIVIFHGDVIYPKVSPWSKFYFWKKEEVDRYLSQIEPEHLSISERYQLAHKVVQLMKPQKRGKTTKGNFSYYLDMLFPPQRLWELLRVKYKHKKELQKFVEHYFPKAEIILYGHFHNMSHFNLEGKIFVNTGAFMRGCKSSMIEITEKQLLTSNVIHGKSALSQFNMSGIHVLRDF